jgi:hypothetical protein
MSTEIQIDITAIDNASAVFDEVSENVQDADDQMVSATTETTGSMNANWGSVSQGVTAFGSLGAAITGTVGIFLSYEESQYAVEKAHVALEKSANSVTAAQNAYSAAVAKYGPDSQQATDALAKLKAVQDAYTAAQERYSLAQQQASAQMLTMAMSIVPTVFAGITAVSNATQMWTIMQGALNAVMDANPIAIVILAIAGLTAAIILLWNYCPPFRDALIEIGKVLKESLEVAITAVSDSFEWLLKNVLEPLADFLKVYIITEVQILSTVFGTLWNDVLKPFGDFLAGAFSDAWKAMEAVIKAVYDAVKPIIDAVEAVAKTLGAFVGDVGGAMKDAGGSIQGFIHSVCFAHALADAADSSQKTMKNWVGMVKDSMDTGLKHIKDFNAQAQIQGGPLTGGTSNVGNIPATKPQVIQMTTNAPLVYVEGSADKATVQQAAQQVMTSLKTIIVEPTSSAAAATQKRIRSGSVFG